MDGNSFPTRAGSHVGGTVILMLDESGNAVPLKRHPPITLEQFCRALAAHASAVISKGGGADPVQAETLAASFLAFAQGKSGEGA